MKPVTFTTTLALAAGLLSACSTLRGDDTSSLPDEFKVVTKAPLTVPPEYSLRPPGGGAALPPELDPAQQPAPTAFGVQAGANASAAERLFVAQARATAANPLIRQQIDFEESRILRKPRSFADMVLGTGDTAEAEASDSATGGGDVVVSKQNTSRVKLPGT